jgi:hypothetical protein
METPPYSSARRVGRGPGGAELMPLRRCLTGRGFFSALAYSTAQVGCAIVVTWFISRQQGNTFASIMGPHRRYRGRGRFFYDPPLRWGGIVLQPQARSIRSWLMER